MAGTGKRADQKKTLIITQEDYFGKHGFHSLQNIKGKKPKAINLDDVEKRLAKEGKKTKEVLEIDLTGYKILGDGELKTKVSIKADAVSKNALEKIKKSGSAIILKKKE